MATAMNIDRALKLLAYEEGAVTESFQFRSVLVTQIQHASRIRLQWLPQHNSQNEYAAILISTSGITIDDDDAGPRALDPGMMYFLHPHHRTGLVHRDSGSAVIAWVPWDSLEEAEERTGTLSRAIVMSPLGRSLEAILNSLLSHRSSPSPYSDYMIELVITEMIFGILAESALLVREQGNTSSELARARSLMLLRRNDPDLTVRVVARELFVSTRHLQRLFAAEGSTPGDELRTLRARLAHKLLVDPNYSAMTVEEIAELSGFRSGGRLRRAFAQAGLPAPRALRQMPTETPEGTPARATRSPHVRT